MAEGNGTNGVRRVAESTTLVLLARGMMVVVGPLTLAAIIWVGSSIRSTERMIDKHELRIEMTEREVRGLKEARSQELAVLTATLAAIQARLAQIETNGAVLAQQNKDLDRRIDELSRYLESRLGIKPPR